MVQSVIAVLGRRDAGARCIQKKDQGLDDDFGQRIRFEITPKFGRERQAVVGKVLGDKPGTVRSRFWTAHRLPTKTARIGTAAGKPREADGKGPRGARPRRCPAGFFALVGIDD